MISAHSIRPKGLWRASPADVIVLDFDQRYRRRVVMWGSNGLEFLLDLAKATVLHDGDALVLEDGRLVEVIAAPEPLAEIRADSPFELVRLAYHLGNRHLPVQLRRGSIRIRRDAVIEDMVRRLGGTIVQVDGPFDPEGGAYGGPDLSVDYGASLEPPAGDHAHGRP